MTKMTKIEKKMFADMEEKIALELLKKAVWHLRYAQEGFPEDMWDMLDKEDRTNSRLWKDLMDILSKCKGDRVNCIYALINAYKDELAKIVG